VDEVAPASAPFVFIDQNGEKRQRFADSPFFPDMRNDLTDWQEDSNHTLGIC